MGLRQDFKKYSGRYQVELEQSGRTSRQQYIKVLIKNLEKEIMIYKERQSIISKKRMELRQKERELGNKIISNEWRIKDYKESLGARKNGN